MPQCAISRIRLRFAKRNDLRLVSHHDLMRCLERLLRRANLPVAHTQGFNPRPRAVFALALALGIEGRDEVLELDLTEPLPPAEVLERLNRQSPAGFDFLHAESVPAGRAARVVAASYAMPVRPDQRDLLRADIADFLNRSSCPFTRQRPDRTVEVDLRPYVLHIELDPANTLRFQLKVSPEGSARPEEIVAALGLRQNLVLGGVLARTGVELSSDHPSPPSLGSHALPAPQAAELDPTGPLPESRIA